MTQEEKQLLLQELCTRLPYGVKILHEGWNFEWDDELSTVERVVGIDENFIYTKVINTHTGEEYKDDKWPIDTFDDKLFLRPMSSMTKEEKNELAEMTITSPNLETAAVLFRERHYEEEPHWRNDWAICSLPKVLNWLNAHHFDYCGLIEKGLAIEVTKENNPYK